MDDLHRQLLQHVIQQHADCTTTPATATATNDGNADVMGQLKHFDDAVFRLLRQVATQRDFSSFVEVT